MLFNSFSFLVFFPLVTLLYFISPYKYRWHILLVASCIFYMAFIPYYILILGGTIVIDFFAGIFIENATEQNQKKQFLVITLVGNIGVLAVFKYYNFFIDNISEVIAYFGFSSPLRYLSIILPIGLSFHTFQAMSYAIEVYRGGQPAERNFIKYSLYVMFFPQLVAGPIERPQSLLPQFSLNYDVNYERIVAGLKQMLWGFFKKIVIADRLAALVKQGYGDIENHDGFSLLIFTYLFSFQIYCDFSGYSDIAIGAAKVLGINLRENFRTPYFSKSIKEFWQRWHMSLSTWFRDYLYIPLGGKKVGRGRWFFNLSIVFLISGLWHGANWTFIVWGALHCSYLIFGYFLKRNFGWVFISVEKQRNTLQYYLLSGAKIFITFNLVAFAWIFFRATSMDEAFSIIVKIFTLEDFDKFSNLSLFKISDIASVFVMLGLLGLFLASDSFMDKLLKQQKIIKSKFLNYALFACVLAFILLFGHFSDTNFIYFQF